MFLSVISLIALLLTALVVYFDQILKTGTIIWWSTPLLFLGFLVGLVVVFVLLCYIITLIVKPDKELSRPKTLYRYIIKVISEFLNTLCRLHIVTYGFDKLPTHEKYFMVCNHQSNFDPIVSVWALRKHRITYIMKDNIMKVPALGRWLYGAGFLPLDRNNNRKAIETINIASKRLINGLHPIAVYPEGTRSKGPHMNEFRNGVFKIPQKAKCPIVVTMIDNTYRVKKRWPLLRTKVLLEIIEVISYDTYKDMSTNEIGDIISQKIKDRLHERRQELSWLKKVD